MSNSRSTPQLCADAPLSGSPGRQILPSLHRHQGRSDAYHPAQFGLDGPEVAETMCCAANAGMVTLGRRRRDYLELWPRVGDGLREGGGVLWGVTKPPGLQARSDTP